MRCKIGIAGLVVLAAMSSAGSARAAGYSPKMNVSMVEVNDDGGQYKAYFQVSNPPATGTSNRPACSTMSSFRLSGTLEAVKAMTSAALAANLSGRQVEVWFSGACEGPYAFVTSVKIY